MSVRAAVEVCCDGPGGFGCPDSRAWTDYGTAVELRKRMAGDGWKVGLPGGLDLCKGCQARPGQLADAMHHAQVGTRA